MSESDRRAHEQLLRSTTTFKVTKKEREETINAYLGDLDLALEEDVESTLELPQLGLRRD